MSFYEVTPDLESYWRAIILFGKNTTSYKFALGKSIFELLKNSKNEIGISDLSYIFSNYMIDHIKDAEKQSIGSEGIFITSCKKFIKNEISFDELLSITEKNAFKYVFDAFHIVDGKEIPSKFFEYDKKSKKLILSDKSFELKESSQYLNLVNEIESRWKLVETAWDLQLPKSSIELIFDDKNELLFVENIMIRRKNITGVRSALNGYQKGNCFYCGNNISIELKENLADVDHLIPFRLQQYIKVNLNGIWNLVLSCQKCNRGENGKFGLLPDILYLNKLKDRNNYFINSHHPLRETLINQNGITENDRTKFIQNVYNESKKKLPLENWKPREILGKIII